MAHGVDNDLRVGRFVEDQIRVGNCHHAADRGIIRARTKVRILRQQRDNSLNAPLHPTRAVQNVKKLIQERARVSDIFVKCVDEGMSTLKMDGMEKVMMGLTDMKQVRAVAIK